MGNQLPAILSVLLLAAPVVSAEQQAGPMRLVEWWKGIAVEPLRHRDRTMFLWFYEWNMFEAIRPGAHTGGTFDLPRKLSNSGTEATITSHMMQLRMKAVSDGAELTLRVTNHSIDPWSAIAGIIPCFNPGRKDGTPDSKPEPATPLFGDTARNRTFFLSAEGLRPLMGREIHFNAVIRPEIDRIAAAGPLPFADKWPTSDVNATAGLIIRESEDGKWVAAIAWEDFLSAQGHNPWSCMHLCVRVGPLAIGQTKSIRGRIYLFPGTKEECLARFRTAMQR